MKGECVCGDVTFRISGAVQKLYQCHCTICQKQTGSSCQTGLFVNADAFEWLTGQDGIVEFRKETGYSTSFCARCGSTVPNMFRSGDKFWIPAGEIAGLSGAKVENHIFVADKAAWDEIAGDGNQHPGFYPVYNA